MEEVGTQQSPAPKPVIHKSACILVGSLIVVKQTRSGCGKDMAYPRQVSATADGSLRIEPVQEILSELFWPEPVFEFPSVKLDSYGAVKKHFLYPTSNTGADSSSPMLMSFKFPSSDAASFGVLFHTDSDLSGYWFRFSPMQTG
ncbi:hypothetical protein BDV29DRAFT_170527 [Aspergillus leporis]|jgi:hypothetical protein|uniref:Uncharacterized protein n=1 Tax=Aspergillus leporis TaxID=41062 RepID=A0A5N5X650_9EURO|nr:hypothetical protein BDV29DRAFT_170527 [Aspergillus leporis]